MKKKFILSALLVIVLICSLFAFGGAVVQPEVPDIESIAVIQTVSVEAPDAVVFTAEVSDKTITLNSAPVVAVENYFIKLETLYPVIKMALISILFMMGIAFVAGYKGVLNSLVQMKRGYPLKFPI